MLRVWAMRFAVEATATWLSASWMDSGWMVLGTTIDTPEYAMA
jgi:hypothetical protein